MHCHTLEELHHIKALTEPKVENSIQAIACVAYFGLIFLSVAKEEISH